ncbi:MAG: secretin N-terminal domain-containing protein [Gammaproteobacteria bacterium]|nr:secretin N-terminal domain-containing protein [Gammaproteobacteria bacterium]
MLKRINRMKKSIGVILLFLAMNLVFAASVTSQKITLDIHNVDLPTTLRVLAKAMHINLVLSPAISGVVSLHWQAADAKTAFRLLLVSQGLSQWSNGDLWFVAPHRELIKRKNEALKLEEALIASAPLVSRTWQIRYAKAEDIAHLLQDDRYSLLTRRGGLRVDPRTNSLYVKDVASSLLLIAEFIQKFDKPVQQVLIEARLASVDSDFERELGVKFSVQNFNFSREKHGLPPESPTAAPRFSLAVATLANGSQLDVALSALEDEGRGELISSPSLFTANQQMASIESGEDIPYQETSANGATSVAFKKAVLSLKVTPQIMPNNKVLLQLKVNQDRPSSRIVLGVPAISTRQIETSVLVTNGQTLVLGGIYEVNKENGEQRIPFLSKIPLLGMLFQLRDYKENKRELLIFVTPKIID